MIKAYKVYVKDEFFSTIVFAPSAGRARSMALATDCCEDADFTDIMVRREPRADELYTDGKFEIDWDNDDERLFLVKNLGWSCFEPSFECDDCKAKPYCEHWEEEKS